MQKAQNGFYNSPFPTLHRQQLPARPLHHQKVPARKGNSQPLPAQPWPGNHQVPALSPPSRPCRKLLATLRWILGPKRQRITRLSRQCTAGLRSPPVSDSSPCFQPLGQSLSPSAAQLVPLGLAPECSLCHTESPCGLSTNTVSRGRGGLARPPSGLWAAGKTWGSGASYCDPGEGEGRVLGSAGTEQNCPPPRGTTVLVSKDQGRSLSWAGSDTKDTPHTQQTRPSHACRPRSSRDTGISSGTLSSSHRGGNKVTVYPRIPGWRAERAKWPRGARQQGENFSLGLECKQAPPRPFELLSSGSVFTGTQGYLASPPSERKLPIPISLERQTHKC